MRLFVRERAVNQVVATGAFFKAPVSQTIFYDLSNGDNDA